MVQDFEYLEGAMNQRMHISHLKNQWETRFAEIAHEKNNESPACTNCFNAAFRRNSEGDFKFEDFNHMEFVREDSYKEVRNQKLGIDDFEMQRQWCCWVCGKGNTISLSTDKHQNKIGYKILPINEKTMKN